MPIQAATPVFTGSVHFGDTKTKKKQTEGDGNDQPPPSDRPPVEEQRDHVDLSGAEEPPADETPVEDPKGKKKFKIDQQQVNGIIGKIRVFLARVLDFEKPEETGWLDILVKIAKFLLDSHGGNKPSVPPVA